MTSLRHRRRRILESYPWLFFVLPFAVFVGLTSLEPTSSTSPSMVESGAVTNSSVSAEETTEQATPEEVWIPYRYYPLIYTLKILATLVAMAVVWPGYEHEKFPLRPLQLHPLGFLVGIVGFMAWVGLCQLGLESRLWDLLGWEALSESGGRSRYNPLRELADRPWLAGSFLVVRFVGLAAVVPVIEEFFLRGFLMRFVMADRWWEIPFGTVNRMAILAGTLFPLIMHPGEMLAAAVWFSMVTWLMIKTRNIWDCVVAHSVTNLLLGIYAVYFEQWQFL